MANKSGLTAKNPPTPAPANKVTKPTLKTPEAIRAKAQNQLKNFSIGVTNVASKTQVKSLNKRKIRPANQ